MQGWLRVVWRFLYFIVVTIVSILAFIWFVMTGMDKKSAGLKVRRMWLDRIARVMGLRLQVDGQVHQGHALFVGNHITYVDPIVVLLHLDAMVVAKAEVKKWPLVGFGANLVGTLFVKREEKSSRQETAGAIRTALEQKESVLVFPEGTTTAGPHTIAFRPRSFQAAEEAGVPVQPFAIYYDSADMPFIGDDTFLPHFFRVFRKKYITGRIAFGPVLHGPGTAEQARTWIDQRQALHHAQGPKHDPT